MHSVRGVALHKSPWWCLAATLLRASPHLLETGTLPRAPQWYRHLFLFDEKGFALAVPSVDRLSSPSLWVCAAQGWRPVCLLNMWDVASPHWMCCECEAPAFRDVVGKEDVTRLVNCYIDCMLK